ncbi:DUF58 domain-containing protein [Candidatus Woesearchaeota archaeon]|nr:DUF58 domain-containing protein [Candidatus Woesearchaeota archaeon]
MAKLNINLTPTIKSLEVISRGLVNTKIVGSYKSSFKGKGLEFSNYRGYSDKDDANLIDWKATLRSNEILVKEFVEERNVEVLFLLDASSSMLFGSEYLLKIEYAAQLMASLYYIVLNSGDSAGFVLFSDKIIKKMKPAQGKGKFYVLQKTLTDFKLYGGDYDLAYALKFVRHFVKPHTLIIIISDFIGLTKDWEHALKIASKEFDIIGIMVRDKHDRTLPDDTGQVVIENPYSSQQLIIDPGLIKHEYEINVRADEAHIQSIFAKFRADFIPLQTDESFIRPIMNFFNKRKLKMR